ncbi:cytochrome c oxidase subunit NDUFA4-like [Neomonachus schauinslandi]|uniref:Cytochrome c oxidase subunit NDUFA4 n=1 Tax=Neomonachus schauinslandi TaxID=29088 RepID=A0A8M1M1M5_NEOSC|nr:cytochrome c oxidase subunit NDUFA4-like [Neomonachus schauinslandi]
MLHQILGQTKKHQSLIPLFVIIITTAIALLGIYWAGVTGAPLYVLCLALFNPDVSWDRKNNPEPWNKLGPNDQYKFYSVNVDYSKVKKEGPYF